MPFFKNCDIAQISVIVPRIQREYAWPGKTVISEGATPTGLYMIGRGFVKVSVQGHLKELLTHPDFFGEQALTGADPSPLTVTTVTLCQFMLLTREQFEEVLELYPSMKKALQRYTANKAKQAKNSTMQAENALTHLMTIKLELQQHGHLLSSEGRKRLNEEIQNLEHEKSTTLRLSFSGASGGPFSGGPGGPKGDRPGSREKTRVAPAAPSAEGSGTALAVVPGAGPPPRQGRGPKNL